MTIRLIFILFLVLPVKSFSKINFITDRKLYFSLSSGMTSINVKTEESSNTTNSSSNELQTEFRSTLSLFINSQVSLGILYSQTTFSESFNSTSQGILGKYYLLGRGEVTSKKFKDYQIQQTPTWNLYSELALVRQTLGGDTISVNFDGIEAGLGSDFYFYKNYYANISWHYSLKQGYLRQLNSQSILFGFGIVF